MKIKFKKDLTALFVIGCLLTFTGDVYPQSGGGRPEDQRRVMERALDEPLEEINIEINEENLITILDVKNGDINDVLQIISLKSSYNIVVDDDVNGSVSIYLNDVKVRDALRIILEDLRLGFSEETIRGTEEDIDIIRVMSLSKFEEKYGYPFREEIQTRIIPLVYMEAEVILDILNQMKSEIGKIIYNDETDALVLMDSPEVLRSMENLIEELDVPIDTKSFELKYTDVTQMAKRVEELLTESVGRVEINSDENSLEVTDTLLKIQEIEKLIKSWDAVEQEILIDVKVIQITLSDEHETGVDWEAIVSAYQSLEFQGLSDVKLKEGEPNISLGTISAEDLTILTEALETVGEIKTVLVDELNTDNNQFTELLIPKSFVSTAKKRTEPDELLSEGDVKFYLKPLTKEENIIAVEIHPSLFVLSDETTETKRKHILIRGVTKGADFIKSATRVIPGIGDGSQRSRNGKMIEEQKSIETASIDVEDGATIVVGSMIKEVLVTAMRKIPLLGDLPFLGFAFRHQGEQLRNTEIIIFLTVKKIVDQEK